MGFITLLWRLVRRRWVRRVLFWLVVRLLRLFGWRRVVKLLFRGRGGWRALLVGTWRAAVRLLRVGKSALLLVGWTRARAPRRLGHGGGGGSRSAVVSWRLSSRIARRRDELRRSLFAAVGVDPEWRPKSRQRIGDGSMAGHRVRSQLGDRSSS